MLLLIFGDELFYYTTFKFICQPLFRSFFKFSFLWRSLLRDSFNIISHSKFFVKYFFQVFSKNFFVTAVPFPDQLFYYITSKTLLSTPFQKFFQICFSVIPQLSLRQLFYYITFPSVCQVLFIQVFDFTNWLVIPHHQTSAPSELSCWTNSLTDSRPFVALSSDSFYIIAWILQFVN